MRNQEESSKNTEKGSGIQWHKYAGVGPHRGRSKAKEPKVKPDQITSLGSLEAEVLGVLWEIGHPVSSMEVMEFSLYRRRAQGQDPASFATIATTLRRLADKGVVVSEKNEQRTPIYWPTVEREEMAARILNNVAVTMLGTPLHQLLPKLIGNGKTDSTHEASRQKLIKALEEAALEEQVA